MNGVIGIYGASGCGRGILPIARAQYSGRRIVFIDDAETQPSLNGHAVLDWTSFLAIEADDKAACIAIASPHVRRRLAAKCAGSGIALVDVRHDTVVQMDDVSLDRGACLSPFVTLTSNISIGRCFHGNIYSYVEHDCVIGDFVTFAPGVKCNGNVTIGDDAYIGAGAVIRQGVVVGAGATIGMGAVVTRDVPENVTVVGNPAKPLIKG